MKRFFFSVAALLLLLPLLVLSTTVWYPADRSLRRLDTPTLPANLDQYLQQEENAVHPKNDTEKRIDWFYPDHRVTEVSLVFLHGFSATRKEISPVVEELAQKLKANVFFTRLHGHGLANDAMGVPLPSAWIDDANEAMAIGRRIGKKVILVGSSTGASLAIHLAQENPPDIQALVLLSANFRPNNKFSWLASGPLGSFMAREVIGPNLKWQPMNERQAYYWTHEYPSIAVHHMMDMLKYIDGIDLGKITIPTLMFYTDKDVVVSTQLIQEKFREFGSPHKRLVKFDAPFHVMAGEIVSPQWTEPTVRETLKFLAEQN